MFPPAQMGYDRAITVFSPDGRLFQVEYATATVSRGTLSIGILCSDGVLLAAEERLGDFQDEDFSRKLFVVDMNIGAAVAGYVPDGRVLIDYAREFCQYQRLLYDEAPYVEVVAKRISDIKQSYTQHGGVRPFGVSIIFGGVDPDGSPQIFVTDPSGSYIKYYVAVIGSGSDKARSVLKEHYRRDISIEDAKYLCALAIVSATGGKGDLRIRYLVVPKKTVRAQILPLDASREFINKALSEIGSK